jgi:hypothetical protein
MTSQEIYEELKELQKPSRKAAGYLFWNNEKRVTLEQAHELLMIDLNSVKVTTVSGFPVIRKWLNEE